MVPSMPSVTVNLYATFREKIGGQPSVKVPIDSGQTIEEVLGKLDVPIEQTRIIFCNNRLVDLTHTLEGGESIGVFPAIGGG